MNLLITSKEQILAELTNIDSFLNITMSEDVAEASCICCPLRKIARRFKILAQ